MNKNAIRNFVEIIYNCPLVLLVLITSLVVIPMSDEINLFDMNKIIPAVHMMDGKNPVSPGKNNSTDEIILADKTEADTVQATEGLHTQKEEERKELLENAGECKEENDSLESGGELNIESVNSQKAVNSAKDRHGTTKFVAYTPVSTDSRYYSDAGKVALTTDYEYALKNESYFNDAAFLGDSRTLGISDYAGLSGADFFCDNGMTIYKLFEDDGVTYQKTGEKVDLKQILQEKRYGKIYIMLGMNELGYGNTLMYMKQYLKVIQQIKDWQPGVIIYIMANLHVSREKDNTDTEFNNININDKNVASARLANGRDIFYLDCNPLFTDAQGYLQEELTFDGVHLYAQHYDKWRDFLYAHCVEREEGETAAMRQEGSGNGTDAAQ